MFAINNKNLPLIALISSLLVLQFVDVSWAGLGGPGNQQQFKKFAQELTQQRDADIAALVKERNDKIRTLLEGLQQLMQQGVAQLNQDKQNIQQRIRQGQDMSQAQLMLAQEEQALKQKSELVHQQVDTINSLYNKEIQNVSQLYAQKFTVLKQQFSIQK